MDNKYKTLENEARIFIGKRVIRIDLEDFEKIKSHAMVGKIDINSDGDPVYGSGKILLVNAFCEKPKNSSYITKNLIPTDLRRENIQIVKLSDKRKRREYVSRAYLENKWYKERKFPEYDFVNEKLKSNERLLIKLRAGRINAGYTTEKIARLIGVTEKELIKYEMDPLKIPTGKLLLMLNRYGLKFEQVYFGSEDRNVN